MARVLITGASRGIGLALARHYADRGDAVIAACRVSSPQLAALAGDVRVETGVDVTSDAAVDAMGARLHGVALDVLINNAGLIARESLEDLDFARMLRQFEVNSLGPLRVTSACLRAGLLGVGARVAIITSRMGSIADNTSGSRYGYRMSKAAANIAGVSLARDLEGRGIAVALLHPGWVRTDGTQGHGLLEPSESAAGLAARIDALTLSRSGGFWHANGESLPW